MLLSRKKELDFMSKPSIGVHVNRSRR